MSLRRGIVAGRLGFTTFGADVGDPGNGNGNGNGNGGFDDTYLGVFTSLNSGMAFSANVTVPAGHEALLILPAMLTNGAEAGGAPIDLSGSYDSAAMTLLSGSQPGTGGARKPVVGALALRNPTTGSSQALALATDINIDTWAVHVWALKGIIDGDFWGAVEFHAAGGTGTNISLVDITTTVADTIVFGVSSADSLAGGAGTAQGGITDVVDNDNIGADAENLFWLAGTMDTPIVAAYDWQVGWPNNCRRGGCAVEIIPA